MHDKGGLARREDLLRFFAFIVGVKDKGCGLDLFEQDHADIWQPVRINGCQSDGVGIIRLGRGGIVEPRLRQSERIIARKNTCTFAII